MIQEHECFNFLGTITSWTQKNRYLFMCFVAASVYLLQTVAILILCRLFFILCCTSHNCCEEGAPITSTEHSCSEGCVYEGKFLHFSFYEAVSACALPLHANTACCDGGTWADAADTESLQFDRVQAITNCFQLQRAAWQRGHSSCRKRLGLLLWTRFLHSKISIQKTLKRPGKHAPCN